MANSIAKNQQKHSATLYQKKMVNLPPWFIMALFHILFEIEMCHHQF